MSGPRVLVLGVGDAFSARHYSSCMAVEANGSWLLVDCPHPIRKILREASASAGVALDVGDLAGVVLTHLHADHCSGLEGLIYYANYQLKKRLTLLAHPEVLARVWEGHLSAGMEYSSDGRGGNPVRRKLEDFIDVAPLNDSEAVRFGPFALECRRTVHSIPTFALRIGAGGRTLGCSADTAFDRGLIEWLLAADLVFHETGSGGLHTRYEELAALPAALRSRMRLIHYGDDFDRQGSVIEPLEQGRVYTI